MSTVFYAIFYFKTFLVFNIRLLKTIMEDLPVFKQYKNSVLEKVTLL